MAKTIKFNLICDNQPIRTIEDLQSNFSIEDVLSYFDNKLLHRWLNVRGYEEHLSRVNAITSTEHIEIAMALIAIFDVETDKKKVEESVFILQYLKDKQAYCELYDKQNRKVSAVINDYKSKYNDLVQKILDNPDNEAMIKANIKEITKEYGWILKLDHRDLFYTLRKASKLAILCLLMNEDSRKYYIPVDTTNEDGEVVIDTNPDKDSMYQNICDMITASDFKESLGDKLRIYAGETDGYWKDLEADKNKKFMIISMGAGKSSHSKSNDYVRHAGVKDADLSNSDIKNKFVILNGLDYKSNSSTNELVYMEV